MIKTIVYFSPTYETKKISDYFLNSLTACRVFDITNYKTRQDFDFTSAIDFLVLSFPIYSQDIPNIVRAFIKKLHGKFVIINTTYGGVSPGNGLIKAANILESNGFKIIGASVLNAHHSYLEHNSTITTNNLFNLQILDSLIEKVKQQNYSEIKLPKQHKNIFANLFPILRSKLSIKKPDVITKNCIQCQQCLINCPVNAIDKNLFINHNCMRCMRCVKVCNYNARLIKRYPVLDRYLKKYAYKKPTNDIFL